MKIYNALSLLAILFIGCEGAFQESSPEPEIEPFVATTFHALSDGFSRDILNPPNDAANDFFGDSVAIDGDRIVVGASCAGTWCSGAAYIYELSPEGWKYSTALYSHEPGESEPNVKEESYFGQSVAIEGDWIAATAPGMISESGLGAVYVYKNYGENWLPHTKLVPNGARIDIEEYGYSVAISDERMVVGAIHGPDDENISRVLLYFYELNNDVWNQSAQLEWEVPVKWPWVTVTLDGDMAAATATEFDWVGQVRTYQFKERWEQRDPIEPSDGISLTGPVAVLGSNLIATGTDSNGNNRVFYYSRDRWTSVCNDGVSIATLYPFALVGQAGQAELFRLRMSRFISVDAYTEETSLVGDAYGTAVGLSDKVAVVSAPKSVGGRLVFVYPTQDLCADNNGGCHDFADCHPHAGWVECTCQEGYVGDGKSCYTTCNVQDICHAKANCQTTDDTGVTCTCWDGFGGDGYDCVDIDECADDIDDCPLKSTCYNRIKKTEQEEGFECECKTGFELKIVDSKKECANIDECELDLAKCPDQALSCKDTYGGYTCVCPSGYEYKNSVCTDIDECAEATASCPASPVWTPGIASLDPKCVNTTGHYDCICPTGYQYVNGKCVDYPECTQDPNRCGVGYVCEEQIGTFYCRKTVCGDGITDPSEECDDGNNGNPCDGCLDNCTHHNNACGDGYICGDEECDDGKNGNPCDGCLDTCRSHSNRCGDKYQCGNEQCDDGANGNNCDGCLDSCQLHNNTCRDGYICDDELCDDGNSNDADACTNQCRPPVCRNDSDCADEMYCDGLGSTATCLPPICTLDSHCKKYGAGLFCYGMGKSAKCAPPDCVVDSDCSSGKYCYGTGKNAKCRSPMCNSDGGCISPEYCVRPGKKDAYCDCPGINCNHDRDVCVWFNSCGGCRECCPHGICR